MSHADSRVVDAATVCLLYAVRIDNVRADALVNTLEARGLLRLLIDAVKSGADHRGDVAAGGSFQSSLLVVRRIATTRDSLYSLFAAALEREHSAATRMLDPLAPQDESESALNEDDEFLWPLTDRVVSLVEVLAAAFDVWFTDGTPSTPELTLIPLRSVACLGSMLRSVRRRLMVLAFGSTTSDSLERGARFCAQLCALVAAAAADGAEWQEAMTRAPDVCDSIIELLRVVAHVEARVPGANFAHIKRELLRALANLLSNHSVMLADHIAAVGGVELLLNSTRVVDSNPYASQWAILALRYACEVSAPVRDVIIGLRREGVVPSDGSAVQVQVQDDGSIKLSTPARDENCND
jgi:hypothetical protein